MVQLPVNLCSSFLPAGSSVAFASLAASAADDSALEALIAASAGAMSSIIVAGAADGSMLVGCWKGAEGGECCCCKEADCSNSLSQAMRRGDERAHWRMHWRMLAKGCDATRACLTSAQLWRWLSRRGSCFHSSTHDRCTPSTHSVLLITCTQLMPLSHTQALSLATSLRRVKREGKTS